MEIETPKNIQEYSIHPALAEITTEIYKNFSPGYWKNISAEFFTTFWQLSLYDISVPEIRYQSEIDKLNSFVSNLESDRTDLTSSGVSKRKREKEKANHLIGCLKEELKAQKVNFSLVSKRLNSEKLTWFKNGSITYSKNSEKFDGIALNFLQDFVYPRCMISPYDAAFCGKFIFLMHTMQVPRFSIINVLHYVPFLFLIYSYSNQP